jgi:hypothetical protein
MEHAYQFEFGMDWHTDEAYLAPRAFVRKIAVKSTSTKSLLCPLELKSLANGFNGIGVLILEIWS